MISTNRKEKCLIMCLTPLQMIIARKVIESNPDKDFDLVAITLIDNIKYRNYYKKLKKLCKNSLYYISEKGLIGFLHFVKELKLKEINSDYKCIYLASIDSRYFQYIISKNNLANIYTFDDGIANIISNDVYYSNDAPVIWKKIIWRFIGIKYYIKDIRDKSLLHYTIYDDIPNIIEKTQLIKLYENDELIPIIINRIVNIYVGQPLEEISDIFTTEYISNILQKLNIDFYYPHPRENTIPLGDFEIIESDLIFEDYIIRYLQKNPDIKVRVYSFISSAILNICSLNRIEVNYIYDKELYYKYKEFYDIVNSKFNIDLVKI